MQDRTQAIESLVEIGAAPIIAALRDLPPSVHFDPDALRRIASNHGVKARDLAAAVATALGLASDRNLSSAVGLLDDLVDASELSAEARDSAKAVLETVLAEVPDELAQFDRAGDDELLINSLGSVLLELEADFLAVRSRERESDAGETDVVVLNLLYQESDSTKRLRLFVTAQRFEALVNGLEKLKGVIDGDQSDSATKPAT